MAFFISFRTRTSCLKSSLRTNFSNRRSSLNFYLNSYQISSLLFISIAASVCLQLPNLAVSASSFSSSSSSSSSESLQIADQQAFLGKLFFYRIDVPSNVQNLTFSQAGHLDSESTATLPDWLYFDSLSGVLFGAPYEKKIYFIQVQAILHNNNNQDDGRSSSPRTYDDIFVIEVVDIPAYLDYYMLYNQQQQQLANSFDSQSAQQQQQQDNKLSIFQCRLELKKTFTNVKQLYQTVIELRTLFFSDHPHHSHSHHSSVLPSSSSSSMSSSSVDQFKEWLNRFNAAKDLHNHKQFKLSYNVEKCAARTESPQSVSSPILLDNNSERLSAKLTQLQIESELVKLTHFDPNTIAGGINAWTQQQQQQQQPTTEQQPKYRADFSSLLSDSDDSDLQPNSHHHHNHHHGHNHHKKHHRRRNAYADDAYATPTLHKEWVTLTTSTIGVDQTNNDYELSRTLIPSMVSPTFTNDNVNQIQSTPTLPNTDQTRMQKAFDPLHNYPRLYSTPILMPDISGLQTKSIEFDNVNLATPVLPSIEPTAVVSPVPELSSSTSVVDMIPKMPVEELPTLPPPPPPPPEAEVTSTPTLIPVDNVNISTTPEPVTLLPNHRPFVNKRISKISITAGKYWQFPIPEDTFLDIEDGNTKQLHLSFFMESEFPPLDYWIQFDHENQYLYALPTEENIGKYRFNLVAVDSQGADVSESLEINVRQSRQSLAFTHQFILANITWPIDQYVERIQAISTLLKRMATQVFEELPVNKEAPLHESILRSISVLHIVQNVEANSWSVIWTNDTLRRHPCPVNEINQLFSKLYEITSPEDQHGFMTPSRELRGALAPEFTIQKIKRQFIGRSACGGYASLGGDSSSSAKQKDKIVISNKLNRLGPYKLGEPFSFQIPKDTVYSVSRQVDTRDLALSLAPVEPELDLPEFIYFDEREQTIYGLPFKTEHVRTYEIKLIVEDTVTGGQERDVFVIDVVHDGNTREDYLFEVTMSFLINNIEQVKRSQIKLTPKDYYQVALQIASRLMANSSLDTLRMLDISRHRFTKISDPIVGNYNDELNEVEPVDVGTSMVHTYSNKKMKRSKLNLQHHHRRRSYHNLRFKRTPTLSGDYYYEFTWTNRSLVTSYSHSANAYGGGSVYETKTCPKDIIHEDIYGRLFPSSVEQFLDNLHMKRNQSKIDLMDIYSLLFETVDANVEFLSVEWTPKSVCTQHLGLEPRILGAKPIRSITEEQDEDDEEEDGVKVQSTESTLPDILDSPDQIPTEEYLGDKLLAMIIPPIAILTALLFAVAIGCCFHRANLRRKAIGTTQVLQDESPSLLRKRIPIQFEFERGRGNLRASEHESMLDPKLHRHGVQVIPMKAQPSQHLPSQIGRQKGLQQQQQHQLPPHPSNLQYQMVPQHR